MNLQYWKNSSSRKKGKKSKGIKRLEDRLRETRTIKWRRHSQRVNSKERYKKFKSYLKWMMRIRLWFFFFVLACLPSVHSLFGTSINQSSICPSRCCGFWLDHSGDTWVWNPLSFQTTQISNFSIDTTLKFLFLFRGLHVFWFWFFLQKNTTNNKGMIHEHAWLFYIVRISTSVQQHKDISFWLLVYW